MDILIIGSGGREHALAWRLSKSASAEKIYCAPGNAGIADVATLIDISVDDIDAIVAKARELAVGLVVVGPEAPLAAGLADRLEEAGVPVFGASAAAAQLETSKAFAKAFCKRHDVPTAAYDVFEEAQPAIDFLDTMSAPYVLKADGLAAGKGVVIAQTREEAASEIEAMLGGRFGAASARLVIEEFMEGEEASYFVMTDGEAIEAWPACQDHKRAYDGDEGPNTGGMGAYCPAPIVSAADEKRVIEEIVRPVIDGMAAEGAPYRGVLYVGLMMTASGPKVVEFNARFGDPETQVLMLRAQGDMAAKMLACATGGLADAAPTTFDPRPAVTVVMASKGYPGAYEKGTQIFGVDQAEEETGATVFHAGTARDGDGALRAIGGRVLNVSALGDTIEDAAARAYSAVDRISWTKGYCRRDIARRARSALEA